MKSITNILKWAIRSQTPKCVLFIKELAYGEGPETKRQLVLYDGLKQT